MARTLSQVNCLVQMRVCKHTLFGIHTLNVCRRNLETFQTQSFFNTRKVISSINDKYRNWRKMCQFFIWDLATIPLKRGTRRRKKRNQRFACLDDHELYGLFEGVQIKTTNMQQNAQKTSKCKETRKNFGKTFGKSFYAPYFQRNHENYISLKSL